MALAKRLLVALGAVLLLPGCCPTAATMQFTSEAPGRAVIHIYHGDRDLPVTIKVRGPRTNLRLQFTSPDGKVLRAKGHIEFLKCFPRPEHPIDKYANFPVVITADQIECVAAGGTGIIDGISAAPPEKVWRMYFGKEN